MTADHTSQRSCPIDAVILWVNGSDSKLTEKRNLYAKDTPGSSHHGAHPTRFASVNEIRYCVLSIFKFAPFIRNMFIVTDGQDPNLYEDIKTFFPERLNSLRIVDHKEIFRGYEKYLPTFNSLSIESLIWRINDLSDNFIYFNDDLFLIREHKPEDWFRNNRPVLRGKWRLPPYKKILTNYIKIAVNRYLRHNPDYEPKHSFYLLQWNTASLLGMKTRYFFLCHTPHPLNRTRIENFYSENKALLESNIAYRFRNTDQYFMISLVCHLEIMDGNRQFEKLNLGYLHPYYSKRRLERRIRRCENDPDIKSVCAQSLDILGREVQDKIFGWMDRILGLENDR
ncbi:MAG: Stealth CR1 domain-containing protein [Bacteroidales bacterium]